MSCHSFLGKKRHYQMFLRGRFCQLLIFDVLRFQHLEQRVAEKIRVLAVVKTEAHFVKVGLQMLCTNPMPRSDDTAFQQREGELYGICVQIAYCVDTCTVIDGLMFSQDPGLSNCARVHTEIVSHNYVNILTNIFLDILRQCARLHVLSMEKAEVAAALPNPDDNFFLGSATALVISGSPAWFAAHIGFVNFNRAAQLSWSGFGHCCSNTMTEIPRRLVVDSKHSLDLVSRNPLARFRHQIGNIEPLPQWQVG